MPGKENLFSQAENDRYNVSNVLRDATYSNKKKEPETIPTAQEILEEDAPFLESIDPNATIGEYMQMNEEEERALAESAKGKAAASQTEADVQETEPVEEEAAAKDELRNPAIRAQAEKARISFEEDMRSLDEESAIQKMNTTAAADEEDVTEDDSAQYDDYSDDADYEDAAPGDPQDWEDGQDVENEEKEITFKDLLKPASSRIKKPRFAKKITPVAETSTSELADTIVDKEESAPADALDDAHMADEDTIMQEFPQNNATEDTENLDEELAEARAAQKRGQSICEDLYNLQTLLEEGRSPFMHKTEVLVPREKTLRLIRSLTAICEVDPSYIDGASEDNLIDRLISDHTEDDYMPLERARDRAQTIIQDATRQADTILGDAKTLARQLLAETEAEIKAKYDEADEQIAVRMTTTKEESTKKLNEARSELTTSRQRSVEILSKYLEKAENDYQGYWERAEHTVMASLEQGDSILGKAADIYSKELATIRQDKEEISEILEHMRKYSKRSSQKKQ